MLYIAVQLCIDVCYVVTELTFQAGDEVMVVGYRDGERWKPVSAVHTIVCILLQFH